MRKTPSKSAGSAGYSGTPLAKKLGIKSGHVVALVGSPRAFVSTLHPLPENVTIRNSSRGKRDLTVWFVKESKTLEKKIDAMSAAVQSGDGLWIAWPKKASGVTTDVTQDLVRNISLAVGLVDYKICAIDQTWSGLKFARRKTN